MTTRVLLTGGSGFVGRHAVTPLRAAGFEVHALGRRPVPGAVSHAVDLLDPEATAATVAGIGATHLLHLAWDVTHGAFWESPANLDWMAAGLGLYRAFAAAGGRRMAAAGTCAEYDWSAAGPLDEDAAPLRPATLYGAAKHALHRALAMAAGRMGVDLAWGRLFFLYGPHEGPRRLVPSVIAPLLRGEPARVGHGAGRRDTMHVADAAAALVAVLCSGHVGPVNIASGTAPPMRELVTMIARQLGRPDLVQLGAHPTPADAPAALETAARVLAGLGFHPEHTLETGLADTIAWWRLGLEPA